MVRDGEKSRRDGTELNSGLLTIGFNLRKRDTASSPQSPAGTTHWSDKVLFLRDILPSTHHHYKLFFLNYISLFVILFSHLPVFAQQDDTIPEHGGSILQTISQDRRLLLDRFNAGRLDSVALLVDSIDRYHCDYPLLWPAERLLLYYWIERYDAIDSLARYFDEVIKETASGHPPEQMVWNVLSYYSPGKMDTLVAWIDQTGCSDEVFDFRVRLLETLVDSELDDQPTVERKILSLMAQYTFREEALPPEAQTVVPRQVETGQPYAEPWQIGFGMGAGPAFVSGNIAQYLSTKAALSFDLNVSSQRYCFSLLIQAIFAKLKRNIPVGSGGDVWEAGKAAYIGNYGLTFGYSIIDNRSLRMTPFVGVAVSECSPGEQQIEDNSALRNAGIRWGKPIVCGVNMDVKLNSIFDFMQREDFTSSFNIKVNYIPAMFSNISKNYSGGMIFVTLGMSMDVTTGW